MIGVLSYWFACQKLLGGLANEYRDFNGLIVLVYLIVACVRRLEGMRLRLIFCIRVNVFLKYLLFIHLFFL